MVIRVCKILSIGVLFILTWCCEVTITGGCSTLSLQISSHTATAKQGRPEPNRKAVDPAKSPEVIKERERQELERTIERANARETEQTNMYEDYLKGPIHRATLEYYASDYYIPQARLFILATLGTEKLKHIPYYARMEETKPDLELAERVGASYIRQFNDEIGIAYRLEKFFDKLLDDTIKSEIFCLALAISASFFDDYMELPKICNDEHIENALIKIAENPQHISLDAEPLPLHLKDLLLSRQIQNCGINHPESPEWCENEFQELIYTSKVVMKNSSGKKVGTWDSFKVDPNSKPQSKADKVRLLYASKGKQGVVQTSQ
jgi:hypothetical protein